MLGLSRCKIIKVDGLKITVQALDAVKDSPVLDIKPYLAEFGPIGEVKQPAWSHELMRNYYLDEN
ncbi:TrmO family methyltransferase domain-containing protein [Brevibacillus sp. SYSU BS000544]|uniref:TrmO family methyltransferase domain-containing protein n=1 Tax=Brevibacillus sp. SYSU BS000544 TaxID=3416443 RepID=UPI003CE448D1